MSNEPKQYVKPCTSVRCRIRCEVEIDVGQWGGDNTMDGLHKQVKKEGIHVLHKLLTPAKGNVIGEPIVQFVIAEYS